MPVRRVTGPGRRSGALVQALEQIVQECLAERRTATSEVDQKTSPLGRRRHLELVRQGALPAVLKLTA